MKPTQKFRQQICYNMKKGGFQKKFDKLKDNEQQFIFETTKAYFNSIRKLGDRLSGKKQKIQ